MEIKEKIRRILYVLFYKLISSIKETLKQFSKTENIIVVFILINLILAGLYNKLGQKLIIYLLGLLFLFIVFYNSYKSKSNFWLHEYKVLKGTNWKDKLKEFKK